MAYLKCLRNVSAASRPDGKTVTPTDDISIWIACGGRSEAYTTLSQVLADSTCLSALINDNNAVDYLVRSTTWASDVCGDSGAMTAIGGNNYAANTLLADSTWNTVIQNSTYFESVDNSKVPNMTSATTPSGEVVSSSFYVAGTEGYLAFDGDDNTGWSSGSSDTNPTVGYIGTSNKVKRVDITMTYRTYSYAGDLSAILQGYDGVNWTDIDTISFPSKATSYEGTGSITYIINNNTSYIGHRLKFNHTTRPAATDYLNVRKIQFYGRADI